MRKKKILITAIALAGLLIVAGVVASIFLPGFLHRKVKEKVAGLEKDGIHVHYDSLQVSVLKNKVVVDTILVDIPKKKLSAKIYHLQVSGLRLLPLLFKRKIHLGDIIIGEIDFASIQTKKDTAQKEESASADKKMSFIVNEVIIKKAHVHSEDSTGKDSLDIAVKVRLAGLIINDEAEQKAWNFASLITDSLTFDVPFYTFAIHKLELNKELRYFDVDTLRIKPRFSKAEHARLKKVEDDRFHGMVTQLRLDGLNFDIGDSTYVTATALKLRAALDVFRNKHYPFPDRDYMPLPVAALKKLPFALTIDSIRMLDSRILYEEIGEEADSSGTVFFDHLKAGLFHVSTDQNLPPPYLEASADFMGSGKLLMTCQFSNTKKPAIIKGSLSNFSLPRLNSVLRPQAKVEAASGTITLLSFNFKFNDVRSDGTTDLSYKNLKVTALREDKEKGKAVKNSLLTAAINTLVKDDAGRFVTGEKQVGTVLFYRDQKKAIFNFWWKSLFSGIKSSFIPRTQATDEDQYKKREKKEIRKKKERDQKKE